jgi:L-alanine-DL-glutamate epimerase-like enolase superfamily enzyme
VHLWDIPYLVPFRIARPDPNEESSRTAFVHLTDRATGIEGWGEGCADPYYGDTPETIAAVAPLLLSVALPALSAALAAAGGAASESGYASARGLTGMAGRAADALAPMSDAMDIALGNHGAAKSAIEQALHDLLARSRDLYDRQLVDHWRSIPEARMEDKLGLRGCSDDFDVQTP